jgi:hypothetical protein
MKRIIAILILCCVAFLAGTNSAKASYIINYFSASGTGNSLTTPESLAVVETFDTDTLGALPTAPPLWIWSGNGHVVIGSDGSTYAAPNLNDTSRYFAIPGSGPGDASVTLTFGGAKYSYLGLYWGSIDTYNQIQFKNNGGVIATVGGSNLPTPSPANGGQSGSATNKYVNFYFTGEIFDEVIFTSFDTNGESLYGPYAFEMDNVAVAVPIPATILLGLLGMGVGGWKLRKSV